MQNIKTPIYSRIGNAEQLEKNEEVKPFTDISNYEPYNGFYDLRDFVLSNSMFKKLWRIQDYLFRQSQKKDYLKRKDPVQWNNLKHLSSEYQTILLNHKLKPKGIIKDYEELEK